MAVIKPVERVVRLTYIDYRELSRITTAKKLKNGLGGYSDIMIRNFYLHGYTCSDAVKDEIISYVKNKAHENNIS